MPQLYVDSDELLAGPFYAFGALLVAVPMLDFVSSILPVHASNLQWRFATLGLLSNFLMTPMLGIGVIMVVAAVREHRGVQRVLAIVSLLIAAALAALVVLFGLDVVQLNASVPAEQASTFHAAAFKAMAKHVVSILVLFWMALAGLRVSSMRVG